MIPPLRARAGLLLLLLLPACGGGEPPPPPPPPPAPTLVSLTLTAAPDVNADGAGQAKPVHVRVLKLAMNVELQYLRAYAEQILTDLAVNHKRLVSEHTRTEATAMLGGLGCA